MYVCLEGPQTASLGLLAGPLVAKLRRGRLSVSDFLYTTYIHILVGEVGKGLWKAAWHVQLTN
jgi:hypothetical protein